MTELKRTIDGREWIASERGVETQGKAIITPSGFLTEASHFLHTSRIAWAAEMQREWLALRASEQANAAPKVELPGWHWVRQDGGPWGLIPNGEDDDPDVVPYSVPGPQTVALYRALIAAADELARQSPEAKGDPECTCNMHQGAPGPQHCEQCPRYRVSQSGEHG